MGLAASISATFDPHGDEDEEFRRHANMAFAVKHVQHDDGFPRPERAARCLPRAFRGDYLPTHTTR